MAVNGQLTLWLLGHRCPLYTPNGRLPGPRAGLEAVARRKNLVPAENRTPVVQPVVNQITKPPLHLLSHIVLQTRDCSLFNFISDFSKWALLFPRQVFSNEMYRVDPPVGYYQ
jgi:hypothetical protein